MKITRTLSRRADRLGRSEVMLRLTVDHSRQYRLKSGIFVDRAMWGGSPRRTSGGRRCAHAAAMSRLAELEERIFELCAATPRGLLSAAYVREKVGLAGATAPAAEGAATQVEDFLAVRELSESRRRQYRTLGRMLVRYEVHSGRRLAAEELAADGAAGFAAFLRDEHRHDPRVKPRGHNTICAALSRLRALLHWLSDTGRCPRAAWRSIGRAEVYGTPYFLSVGELYTVARTPMPDAPALAVQRDIFVFQCLTGCRVSDLTRLTRGNIVEGALEYVARKTRRERPEMVRVPLHPLCADILRRYAGKDPCGRLLPFISPQAYNRAIRAVLRRCGITRRVSVLDPVGLTEKQRRVCDIAGSHLARRTFVGNLYRTAKDPGLVGSMSGHGLGSKAFARYRHIDDSLKSELLSQTFCRQTAPATHYNI